MNAVSEKMKAYFMTFLNPYSTNPEYVEELWKKIESAYAAPERHYHTLTHLAKMFEIIEAYEHKLQHKEAVLLAIWFHDVVYDTHQTNNEERSAEYLCTESTRLSIPEKTIQKAIELILLTKTHVLHQDSDFDSRLFLDADLLILGGTEQEYQQYCEGVRKEYAQYPDFLYKQGRRKIVQHFLASEFIYKTEEIKNKFEEKAKMNLSIEHKQLSL